MTAHPINTEALRKQHAHLVEKYGPGAWAESRARVVLALLDALAAAEHRIARLEAQSDIRGRAVVMYRERAREAEAERDWNIRSSRNAKRGRIQANARADQAEARIEAVQHLIDQADEAGDWTITATAIQRAIDGEFA